MHEQAQAVNPYLPTWEYVPDGEPRVVGDRLFVFGSHDRFRGTRFCQNDYVAWSAPVDDLASWTSHGVMYRRDQDPTNPRGRRSMWAPDVVQGGDGRFYLFHGTQFVPRISVAVADVPEGPYTFLGHVTRPDGTLLGGRPGDVFPFDPGVLVDGDGRVWLYVGFAPTTWFLRRQVDRHRLRRDGAYVVELASDMRAVVGEPRRVLPGAGSPAAGLPHAAGFAGHEFFEAASIRRIGATYYLVYSSVQGHELCYATSDRPDEGFRYGGTLVSNGDIGYQGRRPEQAVAYTGNNHGGLAEVGGRWFVFHHRHTDRSQVSRQGLAEPVEINADGRIAQVEMTSAGLHGGPLRGTGTYPASIACVLRGPDGARPSPYLSLTRRGPHPYLTQTGRDREGFGDQYVANVRHDAVVGFRYLDLTTTRRITVDARGSGEGFWQVSTLLDGDPVAVVEVPARRGTSSARLPSGLSARSGLYLRYTGSGRADLHAITLD
ncbi:family 43 glycosylhydrolase [Cellulomonas triticagri]|uniref:Uncharacterized protein n=1 Tax=Cellulomonas triticagri TaxID=2483352 RepID=A0A3M2JAD5_9CELL|nr:family 43 glycosylhydrolase [Cellulomonas triticagri]RMI09071.1 hypothetical protein EBM89_11860 [Cellulomonas triticagri]